MVIDRLHVFLAILPFEKHGIKCGTVVAVYLGGRSMLPPIGSSNRAHPIELTPKLLIIALNEMSIKFKFCRIFENLKRFFLF